MKTNFKTKLNSIQINKTFPITVIKSKYQNYQILLNKEIISKMKSIKAKYVKIKISKDKLTLIRTRQKKLFKTLSHLISLQFSCRIFKKISMTNILIFKKWHKLKLNNIANNFKSKSQVMMSLNQLSVLVICNLITVSNKLSSNNNFKNPLLSSLKLYPSP